MAPPIPASALQPPAPGQYFVNRPSFSYNVALHANARLSTGQQFQLDTVISHGFIIVSFTLIFFINFCLICITPFMFLQGTSHVGQIPRFVPPGSLQPPAPGQLTRPNAAFPGAITPNSPSTTASSSGSTSTHIQMPTSQSVTPRPESFGAVGQSVPGQPSAVFSNPPSLLGRPIVQSASPLSQTTQSVATPGVIPQNSRPPFYPPYSSTHGVIQPQPLWGHPHPQQPTGFQQAPFQSYPAGPVGFVRPMFGTSVVSTSLPTGVTTVGDRKEQASANPGSEQSINTSAEPPSTGTVFPLIWCSVPVFLPILFMVICNAAGHEGQVNDQLEGKRNSGAQDSDAWSAHKTETGTMYYYNALTGESTYHRPPGYKGEVVAQMNNFIK
jgi:transcription elongation regulator 1